MSVDGFKPFAGTAPAIFCTFEADGTCSFFSRSWHDYTGQNEEEALGFGWEAVIDSDDRAEARRILLEAAQTREPLCFEVRVRRADGEYRCNLISGQPRFDSAGIFEGFIASVLDIHGRKQAAGASALLSAIVDSSDDAIVSKDLNGIIMSWNKSAERLFGYTAAEAIGRSITMIIPPDRLDEEPKILERLRRGERVDHFETIRVRKDGSRLNISLTISPVKDAAGTIVGASKIARDVTEKVRRQAALKETNAALERANADLKQFVYSASHDLQEPLRMVSTYSELLQRRFGGQLGPAADEYIGYTVQGAVQMSNLLRDLRNYTQVSMSNEEPPAEIDAGEVLDKTLSTLNVPIKDSGASITHTPLPRVRFHPFQLQQLFQNLLSNAIRYCGSLPPRIHVAAVWQDGEWLFSVRDNGIGIEPQFKEQIFGIFKRLHSSAEYPGTGMGLAICQRIVERAGGRIWVESEPGRGSTFFFTIPGGQSEPSALDGTSALDTSDRGQPRGHRIGARGA